MDNNPPFRRTPGAASTPASSLHSARGAAQASRGADTNSASTFGANSTASTSTASSPSAATSSSASRSNTSASSSGASTSAQTPRPGAYTDPLVRPTIELPRQKPVTYQSEDIGVTTAVPTDPFVKVEETFGDRLRRIFSRRHRAKSEKSEAGNSEKSPSSKKPSPANPHSSKNPALASSKNSSSAANSSANTNPRADVNPNSATSTNSASANSENSNLAKNPPSQKPKFSAKLKNFCQFLFKGWHKFVTIPVGVVIVVETVVIILFAANIISTTPSAPSIDVNGNLYPDFIHEAKKIYTNAEDTDTLTNTIDYINSTIAAAEESGAWERANSMRREAYFFYKDIAQYKEAATVLANTNLTNETSPLVIYDVYATASRMYLSADNIEAAAYYANLANEYASAAEQPTLEIPEQNHDTEDGTTEGEEN